MAIEGPGAAFGVAVVDVVELVELVVGAPAAARFDAACAGAASAAPTNESSPAAASTPMARERNAQRLFIVSTRLQAQMQDAMSHGAALQIETPQLHRKGPR